MPNPITIPIQFPIKGYVENSAFSFQPDKTTANALNVVPFDGLGDRLRGGRRDGDTKYIADAVNSDNAIQNINQVTSIYQSAITVVPTTLRGSDSFDGAIAALDDGGVTWDEYGDQETIVSGNQPRMFQSAGITHLFERDGLGYAIVDYNGGGASTSDDDNVARAVLWSSFSEQFVPGFSSYIARVKMTTFNTADTAEEQYGGGIGFRVYTTVGEFLWFCWYKSAGSATWDLLVLSVDGGTGAHTIVSTLMSAQTADNNEHQMELRVHNHFAQCFWDGILRGTVDLSGEYGTAGQHVRLALCTFRKRTTGTFDSNSLTFKFNDWEVYDATSPTNFREERITAVSGGNFYRGTRLTGLSLPASGGSGALSATAPLIQTAQAFGVLYMVDGLSYKQYEPLLDAVSTWTPSIGTLPGDAVPISPQKARLITVFRGRIVLSGVADEPHNWFMSAVADPLDWDYGGPLEPAAAVAGNVSESGQVPDLITGMLGYFDDALIFGAASSVWALQGDLFTGGRMVCLTRDVGLAGPRAITHGPNKMVYAFLTDGLYRFSPNQFNISQADRVSLARLDRTFRNIDITTNQIQLAWDVNRHGLWIFITPYDSDVTKHYFYDHRSDSFWPVMIPEDHGPTAVHEYDSDDPDDRAVLVGGRDSYIRYFLRRQKSDDGDPIFSGLTIGPIATPWPKRFTALMNLEATLDELGGLVNYQVMSGDTAQDALFNDPTFKGVWIPGRNAPNHNRTRGAYHYLQLRTETLRIMRPWSLETIDGTLVPSGPTRVTFSLRQRQEIEDELALQDSIVPTEVPGPGPEPPPEPPPPVPGNDPAPIPPDPGDPGPDPGPGPEPPPVPGPIPPFPPVPPINTGPTPPPPDDPRQTGRTKIGTCSPPGSPDCTNTF